MQDRPWNDPGPRRGRPVPVEPDKPTLKAIILDFSSVNNVDVTSVQHLIDVRNQLDRYAAPDAVDWHFACINNRWTKRALTSAGFGYPTPQGDAPAYQRWKPVFSVADIGGQHSAAAAAEYHENEKELRRQRTEEATRNRSVGIGGTKSDVIAHGHDAASLTSGSDLGQQLENSKAYGGGFKGGKVAAVNGLNRPLFHIDLTSALQSAITNVETRGEADVLKGVGTLGV